MLGWSINLFRVFGIQLSIHVSFLLLLAYFGYEGWQEAGWLGARWQLLLVGAFFVCVVLHELGHSLTARRYGVRVPRILLLPIGGMAEFDRIPRRPKSELLITIAGPAVNFVLVLALLPLIWRHLGSDDLVPTYGWESFVYYLTAANLSMGVFNLLPVFPMDGGRILRALLATRLEYLRATYWASIVGRVLAALFALTALYYQQYLLGALFMFIFFAAETEYRQLLRREQEAAYWVEWHRRAAAEAARRVNAADEPPAPPLIQHGPN